MGNWFCGHYARDSQVACITAEVIKSRAEHRSTLVFLHGLGDTGRIWSQQLKRIVPPHCKVICPNAQPIEVSINQNTVMPAWFDIYGLTVDAPQDKAGIMKAAEQITRIVKAEVETGEVALEHIVLGGFSQGGSVALYTALTDASLRGLAGVVVFSSWLPLAQQLVSDSSQIHAESSLPILQFHGAADSLVPYAIGSKTNAFLRNLHFTSAELHKISDLGHTCNEEELKLAQKFIQKVLTLSYAMVILLPWPPFPSHPFRLHVPHFLRNYL
ncbi:acyl protein thioesterase 12 [Echinococcus multilocularis]|uniref:palmitoyl-protein hydrolase n=1 Tax=Echinococcus multilocularis TaxID=6211 RepID=A0A087VXB2_ECHMU|nr:acyl protein thioesterase 12 [Echinococcus multilocularis]